MGNPVQTSYSVETGAAYPGLVANMADAEIYSRVSENEVQIGRACIVGSADRSCVQPSGSTGTFVGVATRRLDIQGDASGAISYESGRDVGLLRKGEIWVEVDEAVSAEDAVFFRHNGTAADLGKFRNDNATGDATAIASAVFRDAGQAGDLVRIYIPGLI